MSKAILTIEEDSEHLKLSCQLDASNPDENGSVRPEDMTLPQIIVWELYKVLSHPKHAGDLAIFLAQLSAEGSAEESHSVADQVGNAVDTAQGQ